VCIKTIRPKYVTVSLCCRPALSRTTNGSDFVLPTEIDEAQNSLMFFPTAVTVHCCPTGNVCTKTPFSPQKSSITIFPAYSALSVLLKCVIPCTCQSIAVWLGFEVVHPVFIKLLAQEAWGGVVVKALRY
jgi:hypothetical protein